MSHSFQSDQLLTTLQGFPAAGRYWLAYSGGLDSSVLLHALARLKEQLSAELIAIHVDHGLSPDSAKWSGHCRQQCDALGVKFVDRRVEVDQKGKGLEAAAREARYAVFADTLEEGDLLLTAHHQDDQAETLLLQLLRGGGVRGLAAMPALRRLAKGWLARPLLGVSRDELRHYAESHGLKWIEDPSNFDTSLERNYLRRELLPQLEQRRSGTAALLARSARHFAESAELLDELAEQDFRSAVSGEEEALMIPALQRLSGARQRNLLRYWIRHSGFLVPDSKNLQRILDELIPAASDTSPLVSWPGVEVRRYRDRVFVMPPLAKVLDDKAVLPWRGEVAMPLPGRMGELRMERVQGRGLKAKFLDKGITIGWRQGGEEMEISGRGGHHTLKKLFQETGVPPWERERRPLIFIGGKLAQVAGLWTEKAFICDAGEQGVTFEWSYAIENSSENKDN